jgi:hypothetical protein
MTQRSLGETKYKLKVNHFEAYKKYQQLDKSRNYWQTKASFVSGIRRLYDIGANGYNTSDPTNSFTTFKEDAGSTRLYQRQ